MAFAGRPKIYKGMFLTDKIMRAYPNGFCGAIVTGQRGIGKSSLALNIGWEVFVNLGFEPSEDAWNEVLKVTKFRMEDVISFIKSYVNTGDKAHLLIWDDAGVYASTMEWWVNRDLLKQLKSVTDTIRSGVTGILITTPSESGLTSILRQYDDYIVQIGYSQDGSKYRVAKGYLKRTLPSGGTRIYKKFKNKFNVMLPDWFFEKYMEKRNALLEEQLKKMDDVLKEKDQMEALKMIERITRDKVIRERMKEISAELKAGENLQK